MIETPQVEVGWVAHDLAAEFPELRLLHIGLEARSGRSPEPVRQRLRNLADRFTGGKAVTLRQQPVPWAYRVFFRQVGIDPDEHRTPVEEIALERMRAGGFPSRNRSSKLFRSRATFQTARCTTCTTWASVSV